MPAAFATQLNAARNRIESTANLAMQDGECGGSPMNMNWSSWQNSYGLDTAAGGSVLSATSALVGQGTLTGLPQNDARRPALGQLYLTNAAAELIFAHGFE